MMKQGILVLLLWVAAVHSQNLPTDCLPPWILFGKACYNFVGYPRLKLDDASASCQMDGASLVSINSIEEHAFVIGWLEKYDNNRDTWLTSGVVKKNPSRIFWLGDGTYTDNINFWLEGGIDSKSDGDNVIYNFSTTQIAWSVSNPSKNSSFICEIKQSEIYKIVQTKRDFDYGLEIDNPAIAPRGPIFVDEPVDTMILSKTKAAFMDCLATGNPKPSYKWYRSDSKNNMVVFETGAGSPNLRFSTIGGRLTIENPIDIDEGIYQCEASNEFGTILSRPASLSFGTLGDFSNVQQSTVQGQVSNGVAIVCPGITARPGKVYQWHKTVDLMSPEMIFIRPEFQTHTFISNSGRLYFSELAPSDAGYYYCTVSLSSMGTQGNYIGSSQDQYRTSIGFRLTVSEGVSSFYRPVIQDDFIKVYPGNPRRGQDIEMECFAYGTAPLVYTWYRLNGDIPARATFTDTRRVMTIPNVQLEDGGQYRCRVDGTKTSVFDEKVYNLNIQAEPYFSYPLTSQHMDVGSRLTWHCEARGKPAPTYTWYKDGKRLENSTGVMVIGNTVVFDQLQKVRDSGMYQCAATNIYGTAFSSAQIRVLEFKPTFRKHPVDQSLSAAVGGNITIVCDPEAAPAPTYEWLRNGQSLGLVQGGATSNGFKMLLNGNLFIENINNDNQGEYTCKVTNTLGDASSSGFLQVFPSIVISTKPSRVDTRVNESATMVCRASAPPNVDVIYLWLFNDHIIDYNRQVEYRLGSEVNTGNLYVVGVQYQHEGIYTCRVTTGMDSDEASAFLRVLGPPNEPSGVFEGDNMGQDAKPVDPNERFVRLYWTDGDDHGSPIIAYTIEFRTNFNNTWRVHPYADKVPKQNVVSAEYPTKGTWLLTNLKPNANHQFRVRAINEFGVGAPSLPTSYIYVIGSAPIVAPKGIRGGGGKVGDLVIRWDPMPEEDYNGLDFGYVVYWRQKPKTQTDDSRWQEKALKPENACKEEPDILLGRLIVCSYTELVGPEFFYTPYETRMRARNAKGDGVLSDIYTIMSAEDMPRATPRNVFAVSFNATAIDVYWNPVINTRSEIRGKLLGYRINYWDKALESEEQARFNILRVPVGSDNLDHGLVIGLVPGHWYVVNVQVITSAGYGPKSENYPMETGNYAPGNFPTEVHVYSIEGVGIRVEFRGISTKVGEQPLMGYKLQYWPSGENIRNARLKDVGRNSYGIITNLTESVLYELRVYGYSMGGQGLRSFPSIYFTVGDGQVPSNPETTEVMAGGSILQASVLSLVLPLILSLFILFPLSWCTTALFGASSKHAASDQL